MLLTAIRNFVTSISLNRYLKILKKRKGIEIHRLKNMKYIKDKYRYFQVTKLRISVDSANRGLQGNFCKVTGSYHRLRSTVFSYETPKTGKIDYFKQDFWQEPNSHDSPGF
jgi:hypothetical protein